MLATVFFRRSRAEANPPPKEQTGGPPDDEATRQTERRLGFIERRLDRIAKRVQRLEETVQADDIAPLETTEGRAK